MTSAAATSEPDKKPSVSTASTMSHAFTGTVRFLVGLLNACSMAAIVGMMAVTTCDVILRAFGRPLTGALDIVTVLGGVAMACALPYTTAVKGHVAVEYFFHMLSRRGRVVVDTLIRVFGIGLFTLLAWQSVRYGNHLHTTGEVTLTLGLPLYPVVYTVALSTAVVALVVLHNLLHPGRETVKP